MRIRLQVRPSPHDSFAWEHAGPSFIIGRAEDCGLRFGGEIGSLVSGHHARIELTPQGALVHDLNSTNGTYVNDGRIERPTPICPGDVVQLGRGGPRFEVRAVENVPPRHASAMPARMSVPLTWGLVALAAIVVVGVALLIAGRNRFKPSPVESPTSAQPVAAAPRPEPTPQRPAPAKPPPSATPASLPPLIGAAIDWETIAARAQSGIVWVGIEQGTGASAARIPVSTGWIASADQVVTIASYLADLEEDRRKGTIRLFVQATVPADRTVYARGVKFHPRYDHTDRASDQSRHHNLAVLQLESPVGTPLTWPRRPIELNGRVQDDQPVLVLGYRISAAMQKSPVDAVNPPQVQRVPSTIARADFAGGGISLPRRVLGRPAPDLIGATVLGADGAVLGTVLSVKDQAYGLLAPALAELIP